MNGMGMNWYPAAISIVILLAGVFCFLQHRKRTMLDAKWEQKHPRAAFLYCGKTVLFYDRAHGNQIEFLDPNGCCHLWYPGNPVIIVGRWRVDESMIYFKYGWNTFNPVTDSAGGSWEGCPIDLWSTSIVDNAPGDILGITKWFPFELKQHPRIGSLRELKNSHRQ